MYCNIHGCSIYCNNFNAVHVGEEPPDEWMSLSERKTSLSVESVDLQSQAESELINKDNWRLSERDNDALEVHACKV